MSGLAHGGRLGAARLRWPAAPLPFLDLSTGINPFPYPIPRLPETVWTRLPEPEEVAALEATAAAAYGVADPAMVVAAPGTQALIGLLPHLLLPRLGKARRVAVLGPTYAEHAHAWQAAGAAVIAATSLDALAGAAVGVLCNPNNPDGRRWPATALLDRPAGGLLVVDEAFADLAPEGTSLAPHLPHPGVIVLRSFGKIFGLAGLRLGFALAAPEEAATIRAALGPWAVSGPAIAIGRAALGDAAWLAATRTRLAAAAADLDACLTASGLPVPAGTPLFRLAESDDAPTLFERLGAAGILVRRFAEQPRWLRFGLPEGRAALARLAAALVAIRREGPRLRRGPPSASRPLPR